MKSVVIKRKDRIGQNNIEQYELEQGRKEQNERKLRNGKKRTVQKWVGKVSGQREVGDIIVFIPLIKKVLLSQR